MRTIVIFEKYELNENGEVKNINTGNNIKTEVKGENIFVKLYIEGKTKRINVKPIIEENFPKIEEVKTEEAPKVKKNKSSRKYKVVVTELNGEVKEFKTFKAANDYYGLRKDYLNYCLTEPYYNMLTKNGLELKSVEKVAKDI